MSKLYKCSKGCGSIEETDKNETPVCCGISMEEISENEVFGCSGCCACCGGCGADKDCGDEEEENEDK